MSFNTTYYLFLIEKELNMYKNSNTEEEKEIYARNIISRSYYTILLHCKYTMELTQIKKYDKDTHKRIIDAVINIHVKTFLKTYKTIRIDCDYYSGKRAIQNEITEDKLDKLFVNIKKFINFNKIKLETRQ